jgi:hypothetical protein
MEKPVVVMPTTTSLTGMPVFWRYSFSALSQRISRGQIKPYRDPHEPNPQRVRRIRLTDLDQFMREGILRKPGTTLFSKYALPIQGISLSQLQYQPISRNTEHNQP